MSENRNDYTGDSEEAGSPDAFALVGNEVRAEIIRALGDARVEEHVAPVIPFEELRRLTDVDVGPSRFNYHLQRLVDHYITRTDEGYRMRAEGRILYQTLRAGIFDPHEIVKPVAAGFECHYCETAVTARIEEGTVSVQCPNCGYIYGLAGAPPGTRLDVDQVAAYYHHCHLAFARGICNTCGSKTDTEIKSVEGLPFADPDRQELYVYRSCSYCGDQRHLTVGTALLTDPELVSFCLDHGVDVLSRPLWELEFTATDRGLTVESTDPWRISLEVTFGEETLELLVDGALNVIEHHRTTTE